MISGEFAEVTAVVKFATGLAACRRGRTPIDVCCRVRRSSFCDLLAGAECPENAFCTAGSIQPERCNDGQYIPFRGATSAANCAACPGGYYCTNAGGMQKCQAGHFCSGGATTATQNTARAGWYAPEGSSTEFQCPAGTTSSEGQGACTECQAGQLCDDRVRAGVVFERCQLDVCTLKSENKQQYMTRERKWIHLREIPRAYTPGRGCTSIPPLDPVRVWYT